MIKSLLVALTVAALPVAASAAPARTSAETVSVGVAYADLALDKKAGADTLKRRVATAVNSVCERPSSMRDLKAMSAWQECREVAQSKAMEQLAPMKAFKEVALVGRY